MRLDVQYEFSACWVKKSISLLKGWKLSFGIARRQIVTKLLVEHSDLESHSENSHPKNEMKSETVYYVIKFNQKAADSCWVFTTTEALAMAKVPILKEVNFGKMQLCRVEHFYNIFVLTFGHDCWIQ